MSRRLSRIALAFALLLSSEIWALGLGDIQLDSALNEPLRAEIELLSATPEELSNLTVALASAASFDRYGIDRPAYLLDIQFRVVPGARPGGTIIQVRSATPMTEPFLTFLVEAAWPGGRMLREYTVLLDPPTFATRRSAETAPVVSAPQRSAPRDTGRIERAQPAPPPRRSAEPVTRPAPQPAAERPAAETTEQYDTRQGADVVVQRGDTLWGITTRVRPDRRLTMNQTMLAIFEANPDAFGGNINVLRAGARLRIPSADQIYRISRGEAFSEVERQNLAWGVAPGEAPPPPVTESRPSLTLVPPDEDIVDTGAVDADVGTGVEPPTREEEIEARIAELEAEVPDQPALLEVRNNELATLRQELANIRGEVYEPPVEEVIEDLAATLPEDVVEETGLVEDEPAIDEPEPIGVDVTKPTIDEPVETAETQPPAQVVRAPAEPQPGLLERVTGALSSFWTMIVGALLVLGGLLFWFLRRRGAEEAAAEGPWQQLDADEVTDDTMARTEALSAPIPEEAFVVVEQEKPGQAARAADDTVEQLGPGFEAELEEETGTFGSLEDTFSSETAINLDQSDPIAEADFHMAYGLYDQAADLINGALNVEPDRHDLLTKLCEIYFVWGNRDAFVDAANRLRSALGGEDSADWNKTVIMGQQIAGDHELFAGASPAGATQAVDLAFGDDAEADYSNVLDMNFEAEAGAADDFIDLGEPAETSLMDVDVPAQTGAAADFDTNLESDTARMSNEGVSEISALDATDEVRMAEATSEMPALDVTAEVPAAEATSEMPALDATDEVRMAEATSEMPALDVTAEVPAAEATSEMPAIEPTVETPTIEEQFDALGGTSELPSLAEGLGDDLESRIPAADQTAEINLDDLDLDLAGLGDIEEDTFADLDETLESQFAGGTDDESGGPDSVVTGKNPQVEPSVIGTEQFAGDQTDVEDDANLLDKTGMTQVLGEDLTVQLPSDADSDVAEDSATMLAHDFREAGPDDPTIGDDEKTLLARFDEDEDDRDFDFARTEALPREAFHTEASLEETSEMPAAVASTDMDLDLDDLTASLKASELGMDPLQHLGGGAAEEQPASAADDTIEQALTGDETIEQALTAGEDTIEEPLMGEDTMEEAFSFDETVEQRRPDELERDPNATMELGPGDMSDDLHDARTMTEVGTKLDLARAYVDMGDPGGARSILEEVLDEGDDAQRQQAQQLLDSLPA